MVESGEPDTVGGPTGEATGRSVALPAIPSIELHRALKGKATGFVHLEYLEGTWWLVDSEANAFWDLGVNCVAYPHPGSGAGRMNRKYTQRVVAEHPDEREWAKMTWDRLQDWGFTSVGAACDTVMQEEATRRGNFFYVNLNLSHRLLREGGEHLFLKDPKGRLPLDPATRFPDPFNEEWRERVKAMVKEIVPKFRENRSLIGYFVDNEIVASGDRNLFGYFWSEACLKEVLAWLQKRYENSIEALNRAWGCRLASFVELERELRRIVGFAEFRTEQAQKDLLQFERYLVKAYVDYTYDVVRKFDPNHLIIGNRFALTFLYMNWEPLDLFGKYDLVAVNYYPMKGPFFSHQDLQRIERIAKLTGKPVLISEWNLSARESGHIAWGWGYTVNTFRERAEGYGNCIAQLVDLPYVVGAHWHQWVDAFDVEDYNAGILQESGEPYPLLVKRMRETNRKAVHAKRGRRSD
ncbi:beta-galactosidase [Petrachloros mirabilis]